MGAYGDAGCILTNDDSLSEKFRLYARHGALVKHQHKIEGINSRMDGLQAAILCQKLKHIHKWNELRSHFAARYSALLNNISGVATPKTRPETFHTFHLYVIKARKREALMKFLKERGVETSIHYPTPLPFLEAYQYLGHSPNDFPQVVALQSQILSLPLFPEITEEQVLYVANAVREFYTQ
jgi:dTDP-4-amino-4,6-dideoxygalactose transaminase